jgi:N-acyl-D-amino-acid deacylase
MIWLSAAERSSTARAQRALQAILPIDNGLISQVGKVSGRGKEEIDATARSSPPASSMFTPIMTARRPGIRNGAVELAWRDDGCHGQLRRRLCACQARPHEWLISLMEGVEDIPGTALPKA